MGSCNATWRVSCTIVLGWQENQSKDVKSFWTTMQRPTSKCNNQVRTTRGAWSCCRDFCSKKETTNQHSLDE